MVIANKLEKNRMIADSPLQPSVFLTMVIWSTFLLPTKSLAQPGRDDIMVSAGIGYVSGTALNIYLSGNGGSVNIGNETSINGICLHYFVTKNVAIGFNLAQESIIGSSNSDFNHTYQAPYTFLMSSITIAPELEYEYVNKRYFQLYALIGAGYAHISSNYVFESGFSSQTFTAPFPDNTVKLQVSPFCFRFGYKVYLYGELGYGYKGIINFGLAYHFMNRKIRKSENVKIDQQ